ncbi:OmpA family protein [Spongiivirga sp. MCCC 1A20706]|uniref:OmpA family protein n=1 Tax=Spongiivirga sp. MCCC 1A20706 TaxID=3160963 RepID=UPI0039776890
MKTTRIIVLLLAIFSFSTADAQLWKKLKKRAAEAAEEALKRKVEEKAANETEKTFDSIFNSDGKFIGLKKRKKKRRKNRSKKGVEMDDQTEGESMEGLETDLEALEVYSKFDFVPGEEMLLYDDFSNDALGDFPSRWDTNGSGELVEIDEEKWFRLVSKSVYVPMLENTLPEEYTIEFDLLTKGLDLKTSSQAMLEVWLHDNSGYQGSPNRAWVEIPMCLFIDPGFIVEKRVDDKRIMRNQIGKDIRSVLLEKMHISIAVNKSRFRLWVNENKVVDIPRLVPEGITNFKLYPKSLRDEIDQLFITNFKIAAGGQDLRNQLLEEGRFTTTGILFNSGSASIKAESYGVLKKIAKMLEQGDIAINIIGHTDSDGDAEMNLALSQDRAEAVKQILIDQFLVDESLIATEGMGEENPLADNTSPEGKAQNRRVEFVKTN